MKKILLVCLLIISVNALDIGTAVGFIKDTVQENKKEPVVIQDEDEKIAPWKRDNLPDSKPIIADCEYEKKLPTWKRSEQCRNNNLGDKNE